MSAGNFTFYNVKFKRMADSNWMAAEGEVTNKSSKNYNVAVFRMVLFEKQLIMWSGVIKVPGLRIGQTKGFEALMDGMSFELHSKITRHEIDFESGY